MKNVKSMWLFFLVSVLFESKSTKIQMIIDVLTPTFSKKVKKVCFQNGNTICEHKFQMLNHHVTELDHPLLIHTLKKKEPKKSKAVLADFLKKYFF